MLYLTRVMHQRLSRTVLAVAAALLVLLPRSLGSHEIPARVAVLAFVKAAPNALRLVVRVPLEAMRDLEFPLTASGALDLVAVRPLLDEAAKLWIADYLRVWADGEPLDGARVLATRVSTPDDRSFERYDLAVAHLGAPPLEGDLQLRWQQALLDLLIEFPAAPGDARFAIDPALGHLGVRTTSVLRLVLADGAERAFTYEGNPGRIDLDPGALQAAGRFVREGFRHILGGIDHLLFVLCLVLPVRRWRPLVAIVTSFTVAHSITLGAAALGFAPTALWFPPLVEAVIALSIVILAVENVLLPTERLEQRWRIAFAFGLVHGFGFSFALGEQLQFAGGHLVAALAAFNAGVELGQLAALAVALPLLHWVRRHVGEARGTLVTIVGSLLVAHTAWHWMTGRFATLAAYRDGFTWPVLDATFALGALRAGLLLAVALASAWGLQHLFKLPWRPRPDNAGPT